MNCWQIQSIFMIFSHLMEKRQKKSCGWHTIYTLLSHYSPHLCFYILFNFFLASLFLLPLSCMLLSCIRFSKNQWNQYARNININCCCCWLPACLTGWLWLAGWVVECLFPIYSTIPIPNAIPPPFHSLVLWSLYFFFGVRYWCIQFSLLLL